MALSDAEMGRTMSSGIPLSVENECVGEMAGLLLSLSMAVLLTRESLGFKISNSVPLWLMVNVEPAPMEGRVS